MNRSISIFSFFLIAGLAVTSFGQQTAAGYLKQCEASNDKGADDKAVEYCTKAIGLDPALEDAILIRALIYKRQGRLDDAIADQTRLIEVTSGMPMFLVYRAELYLGQNKADLAFADLNKAIERRPEGLYGARAYYYRGTINEQRGNKAAAVADYEKAVALRPSYAEASQKLAALRPAEQPAVLPKLPVTARQEPAASSPAPTPMPSAVKLPAAAAAVPVPTTTPFPAAVVPPGGKTAEVYYDDGTRQMNSGDYRSAVATYTACLKADPQHSMCLFSRALAKNFQGDKDGAIADYTLALTNEPDDSVSLENRASLYREKKRYDLALADYNSLIELDDENSEAYMNRGATYLEMQKLDLALGDLTKSIALAPNEYEPLEKRGDVYMQKRDHAAAVADYSRAIELRNGKLAESLYIARAKAYCAQGQNALSLADLKAAGWMADGVDIPCRPLSTPAPVVAVVPKPTPAPAPVVSKPAPAPAPTGEQKKDTDGSGLALAWMLGAGPGSKTDAIVSQIKAHDVAGNAQAAIDLINAQTDKSVTEDLDVIGIKPRAYIKLKNMAKADEAFLAQFAVIKRMITQSNTEAKALIGTGAPKSGPGSPARYLTNSLTLINMARDINLIRSMAHGTTFGLTANLTPKNIIGPADLAAIKQLEDEMFALMGRL